MLKNKMFGRKIKNIVILLMVILIVFGIYRFIRNSLAENIIEIDAIALDNYGYLGEEEFKIEAKEVSENLFEFELPENVNSKKVNNIIKLSIGEQVIELTDNKVQLTSEQIETTKINVEVAYDIALLEKGENEEYTKTLLSEKNEEERKKIEITEETETLYSRILRYEDEAKGKLVEVKGFLPLDAKLQVEQVSKEKLKEIFGDGKIDVAYDIKIIREIKTEIPKDEQNGEGEPEYIIETIELNPEDFGEKCEVSIKDVKIEEESQVYHVNEDNTYEQVTVTDNSEENISFEAKSFSIYAVSSDEGIMATAMSVTSAMSYLVYGMADYVAYSQSFNVQAYNSKCPVMYTWSTSKTVANGEKWYNVHSLTKSYTNGTKVGYINAPNSSATPASGWYLHLQVENSSETSSVVDVGPVTLHTAEAVQWGFNKTSQTSGYLTDSKSVYFYVTNDNGKKSITSASTRLLWSTSSSATNATVDGASKGLEVSSGSYQYYQTIPTNVEGNYYLHAKGWAMNGVGQASVYKTAGPFAIDNKAPTVPTLTNSSGENWTNQKVTVTFKDGSDGFSGFSHYLSELNTGNNVYVSGSSQQTTSGKTTATREFSDETTSDTYLQVWTIDKAGNTSTVAETPIKIDRTVPTLSVEMKTSDGNSYSGGWTNKDVKVTASYSDSLSGINKSTLEWKDNASQTSWKAFSNPGASSYTDTWSGEGNRTGYNRIKDNAGNQSSEVSFAVKIDKTPPEIKSATFNEETGKITVSASDALSGLNSSAYKFGSGSWQTSNVSNQYTSAQTVTVTVRDAAGNEKSVTVNVPDPDSVPPTLTVTKTVSDTTGTDGWTKGTTTLSVTASDAKSGVVEIQYKEGSGSWTSLKTSSATSSLTASKTWSSATNTTVYFRAKDEKGNWSDGTKSETVKIDPNSPNKPTLSKNPTSEWAKGSVTVSMSGGTDSASGFKQYYAQLYNANTNQKQGSATTHTSVSSTKEITDEGKWKLEVITYDKANNQSNAESIYVNIDKTAPSSAGTLTMKNESSNGSAYTSGTWTSKSVYVAIGSQGNDALSGIDSNSTTYTIKKNGTAYKSNQTAATTLTESGTYTITLTATDKAGNTKTSSEYTVKIDKTNPTAGTLTLKKDNSNGSIYTRGTWSNKPIYVKVNNGSDNESGHNATTYKVNGEASKSTSSTTTITTAGTHTVVVTTTDNAGNEATATYGDIMYDPDPPVISTSKEVLKMTAGGSTYTSGTLTNKDVVLSLDSTVVSDALSGVASLTYSVNGGAAKTSSTTLNTSGIYTIVVTATDGAGNTATKTYTVDIDKSVPTWDPQMYNEDYTSGTYTFEIQGNDDIELNNSSTLSDKVTIEVTNGTYTNFTAGTGTLSNDKKKKTFQIKINGFTGGTVSINVAAGALIDKAGNTSNSQIYTFTYDATSPVWDDEIHDGTFSLSAQTYKFNLTGSDEYSLNKSASTVTNKLTIKVGTTESNMQTTTNYTIGNTTTSGNSKTFPITINGFTGGYVSVEVAAEALVDTTGNKSAKKTYPTFWIDGERPVWNDSIIDGSYNADAGTYTLKFRGTDNYKLATTTLSSSNVTITAEGTPISSSKLSFGTIETSADGKTKTFPLTINDIPGGNIKITISESALKDEQGNPSLKKEYPEFYVDVTDPTWDGVIHNGTYTKPQSGQTYGTYSFELKGSDNIGLNNTSSVLNSSNMSITVGGETASFTVGETSLNDATKIFPITINNFKGGQVVIKINANALVDTSGNKSAAYNYTAFLVDITSPLWDADITSSSYNASTKKYTIVLAGEDETQLNASASDLASKISSITINGQTVSNWEVTSTSTPTSKRKTFTLVLNQFETSGELKIYINEGALVDATGNKSIAKTYTLTTDVIPPEWQDATGIYNPDNQSYTITVTGSDNLQLNNGASVLSNSNSSLTVGGTPVTPTITLDSQSSKSETYTVTWPNHTGGKVVFTINQGALVDAVTNISEQRVFEFSEVDATKPVWDDNISNPQYTLDNDDDEFGTFTFDLVGRDETGLIDAESLLNGKITIKTGETEATRTVIDSSKITIGTPTLTDGKVKKFPITVTEFEGGYVQIIINEKALKDTTGNKSNDKVYEFFRDVTRPEWAEKINEALYNPTTKQYTFNFVGSDENELDTTNSVLNSSNVSITFGQGDGAVTPTLTFGTATVSGNTKIFPVTVDFTNYVDGQTVYITISKGALIDGDGNVSLAKPYTFVPDITAPTWERGDYVYNPDEVSYTVELIGKDEEELNTTLSTLIESGSNKNVTVTCGNTTVTPVITKISSNSKEVRYSLRINNYPGGAVKINIDAGALIDVSENQSIETEITLPEQDIIKPTITAQNPAYSEADKTYTFELVASDNIEIDDTTSALTTIGNAPNVKVECPRGDISQPTISTKQVTTTQIVYQVTIQNYPAGVVEVKINEGSVFDVTGNKNVFTELKLPALDIAKPKWKDEKPTVNYNEEAETIQLSLIGIDETSINDGASTLELGTNLFVYIGGELITDTNKVVIGTTSMSNDQLQKTFPLTINDYTGGIIEISISSGALKDNNGKMSDSRIYTFTDIIKPKWTIAEKGIYDKGTNVYTIEVYAEDDTSINSADLSGNLTVYVDSNNNGTFDADEIVTATATLVNDGDLQKTYTIAISNYFGGAIGYQIEQGALCDDENNLSNQANFVKMPDITPPDWSVGNVEFDANDPEGDLLAIELWGTDNVLLANSSLAENNITVQLGGSIIDRANIELLGPVDAQDEKGGVIYTLKIDGYTGDDITIIISADTLTDDSGNKSLQKTITTESIIPTSDDDIPTVSEIQHYVDALNGVVYIEFKVTDSWYNFADLIEAGEYTMSGQNYNRSTRGYRDVSLSAATITVVKETRIAKGYYYKIRIDGLSNILQAYTSSGIGFIPGMGGGTVYYPKLTVVLNANAAKDKFGKGNVATNLLDNQEIDFSIDDGEATITLKGVRLNKTLETMYIDLKATWTNSSSGGIGWWPGFGGSSSTDTDFSLTEDMITALTIDGVSILDYMKDENTDRLLISNGTRNTVSSQGYIWSSSTVYDKDITIALEDLVESTRQTGKEYLEWSGNVSLTVTPAEGSSYTFEENPLVVSNDTENSVMFADLINPEIEVVSSTINDEDINSVTVRVKLTDKYFVTDSRIDESKVKVTVDGEYATEEQGIYISFGTEEELYTTRNSAQEQCGIVQDITITGLADKLDKKIQLRLESGAVADLSGNTNTTKIITLFNWLKEVGSENGQSSAFLGITDTSGNAIQRQYVESVEFLNTTSGAPSKIISAATGVFDVSAVQDGSIIAWYTGTGPYQVYIASDNTIYANPNSSYLFAYVGYDSTCTSTTVLKNLNLLNTIFAKDMSFMFYSCGYQKMSSLTLGNNFNTSNVTDMDSMFEYCGNSQMSSLNLGEKFYTKNVTSMSKMFRHTGYSNMTILNLGSNFNTSNVESMLEMFYNMRKK